MLGKGQKKARMDRLILVPREKGVETSLYKVASAAL